MIEEDDDDRRGWGEVSTNGSDLYPIAGNGQVTDPSNVRSGSTFPPFIGPSMNPYSTPILITFRSLSSNRISRIDSKSRPLSFLSIFIPYLYSKDDSLFGSKTRYKHGPCAGLCALTFSIYTSPRLVCSSPVLISTCVQRPLLSV